MTSGYFNNCKNEIEPFLKWPGGKRWIAPFLADLIGINNNGKYFEPFLGSGSVFFTLQHPRSILSDINAELIECFKTIRDKPDKVWYKLKHLENSKGCYLKQRISKPKTNEGRAARLIYLMKTCWGGIYRLNRQGKFNVPFGNSGRSICQYEKLLLAARVLNNVELRVGDFAEFIINAGPEDVVYADPPYTTLGQNNGFIRYNERLFAWKDQVRLASVCSNAGTGGAKVIVSGLWHESILSLYAGWWAIKIKRKSTVSRLSCGRKEAIEVLITNFNPYNFVEDWKKCSPLILSMERI